MTPWEPFKSEFVRALAVDESVTPATRAAAVAEMERRDREWTALTEDIG